MKRFLFVMVLCFVAGITGMCFGEENYIMAQPGDQGGDVELVLQKCAELGFIKNIPENSDHYAEEYERDIRAMEKALGFEEDGMISLEEYKELQYAICKGSDSKNVKEILERLFDLGYIQNALPEKHSLYEARYVNSVKNAEKKLGLHADGILLTSELRTIRNQPLERLSGVQNVRATSKNGKVTVSWSAVKGATAYQVYRDSSLYATVTGKTSYTDENVEMGNSYSYSVKPISYFRLSSRSNSVTVDVEIVYTKVSLKEVNDLWRKKKFTYVSLGTLNYVSGHVSGKDYIITVSRKINNETYYAELKLEDYKDWTGVIPSIQKYRITKIDSCKGHIDIWNSGGNRPTIILNYIYFSWK